MALKAERGARYREKMELASERITNIREWHQSGSDLKSRLATYKAFQESAEALMDLGAMVCKDAGKTVKDDYENIQTLCTLKIIDEKLAETIKELNGMRNRVVHEYNGFSYQLFSQNVERLLKAAEKYLARIEEWTKK
ncbi:MAG: DUF86 domain-containing protein [Candidatus Diapherotrites archaeon]|nr:DUF86 domain-containing protein [Candidatus Diapherotrites archaeon]